MSRGASSTRAIRLSDLCVSISFEILACCTVSMFSQTIPVSAVNFVPVCHVHVLHRMPYLSAANREVTTRNRFELNNIYTVCLKDGLLRLVRHPHASSTLATCRHTVTYASTTRSRYP